MPKQKYYPLAFFDKDEKIAWIDFRGNYHCKRGKKKIVVRILKEQAKVIEGISADLKDLSK